MIIIIIKILIIITHTHFYRNSFKESSLQHEDINSNNNNNFTNNYNKNNGNFFNNSNNSFSKNNDINNIYNHNLNIYNNNDEDVDFNTLKFFKLHKRRDSAPSLLGALRNLGVGRKKSNYNNNNNFNKNTYNKNNLKNNYYGNRSAYDVDNFDLSDLQYDFDAIDGQIDHKIELRFVIMIFLFILLLLF